MRQILICECKQEISSFNPILGCYNDFVISIGEDFFARHHGMQSEVAGAMSMLGQRSDLALIPGYGARAITSGGILPMRTFSYRPVWANDSHGTSNRGQPWRWLPISGRFMGNYSSP